MPEWVLAKVVLGLSDVLLIQCTCPKGAVQALTDSSAAVALGSLQLQPHCKRRVWQRKCPLKGQHTAGVAIPCCKQKRICGEEFPAVSPLPMISRVEAQWQVKFSTKPFLPSPPHPCFFQRSCGHHFQTDVGLT